MTRQASMPIVLAGSTQSQSLPTNWKCPQSSSLGPCVWAAMGRNAANTAIRTDRAEGRAFIFSPRPSLNCPLQGLLLCSQASAVALCSLRTDLPWVIHSPLLFSVPSSSAFPSGPQASPRSFYRPAPPLGAATGSTRLHTELVSSLVALSILWATARGWQGPTSHMPCAVA